METVVLAGCGGGRSATSHAVPPVEVSETTLARGGWYVPALKVCGTGGCGCVAE